MREPPSNTWTFFFPCVCCFEAWLEEVKADSCEPMTFSAFVNWGIGRTETLRAAAPPSVTYLALLEIAESNESLYQASVAPGLLSTSVMVEISKLNSLLRLFQTISVDRVISGEFSGLRSMFQMC